MLINQKFQATLSNKIKEQYNKIISTLSKIEKNYRSIKEIEGTGGKVSISDIIAYQIGWGNLLINWYESGLQDKMPDMPGEGYNKWDYIGLAQIFYKKYQYDSYYKQEEEFKKVVIKIIEIIEHEYKTGNLDKTGIWPWCTLSSGKQWPLSKWITINTVAPYKRASGLIKKSISK